jgi:hypothetical protein
VLKSKKLSIFKKAFVSLVLPILEYSSVVWCPIYAKDINALEVVLRRFTKRAQRKCGIVYETYRERLTRWDILSLESRRLHTDLIVTFKILYGFMDVNRDDYFRVETMENHLKVYPKPINSRCRNNTQTNTLAYRTYQIWNALPVSIKNSLTVQSFKAKLKKLCLDEFFISKIKW